MSPPYGDSAPATPAPAAKTKTSRSADNSADDLEITAEETYGGEMSWATLRTLFSYMWPKGRPILRLQVVAAFVCLILAKVMAVFIPIYYARGVDALSGEGLEAGAAVVLPLGIILAYGIARFSSLAFNQLRDALFARVVGRTIRMAALDVFRHLHALSLRFHLARQTGGLSRSIERGTRAIGMLIRMSMFNLIPTVVELLLATIVLWIAVGIDFALATLATVVFYIAFTIAVTQWRLVFIRRMNESDDKANSSAIDSLINYETVKYFNNEGHEAGRYDAQLRKFEDHSVKSVQTLSMLNTGQVAIISFGITMVMYMAAADIVSGEMKLGGFVLVNTYLLQLSQPLNFFGWVYKEIKQSITDMEKMFSLLREDREVADTEDAAPLDCASGASIRFDGVEFAYDERRPVLRGVSFEVAPGTTTAVVGPSGSGKSTLARLLYRFYDVQTGRVEVAGQDIRQVTQDSLRGAIGIVPQDTVLFNDSLSYNIAYGRPGATEDDIRGAARAAHIDGFIATLPDGLETTVGERGLKLSGGEKQRVAIARTVLKDPSILILDEATSALDSHTEREIQQNLQEVSRNRTTLVIAHRLSTIVDADQILVMQDGQILERGRHADLLAKGGAYSELWQRQQESRETEASHSATQSED
ncbi:MAG: ABC transporter ATP-binding protein/permease [Alphaproteobacteria bacterium]